MRAKLVKKIPQRGLPYYFREYEFECIDCGAHYRRKRCDGRTTPYCSACQRKHDKEKQNERKARKERELIVSTLDKMRARIELEKLGYPPSAGYYKAIMKVLEILDNYKAKINGK